jgi:hypothetical protein
MLPFELPRRDDEMASLWRVALCACIAAAWDFFAPPAPKHAPLLEIAAPFRLVGVFHKTGTDFTIKLQTELERVAGVASGVLNDVDGRLDRVLARLDRDPRRATLWRAKHPDTPLATLRAAFPTVRVVVLVRDPVALVVSGYNYHAQPRAPEGWIDRVRAAHPSRPRPGIVERATHRRPAGATRTSSASRRSRPTRRSSPRATRSRRSTPSSTSGATRRI